MKNLLKKLSGAPRNDRRESLENEAAQRIQELGGQAPAEAYSSQWVSAASPAPASPAPHAAPVASGARRLTVQERVAARELQGR
ncbi:MAG: hypothetical protein M3N37_04590 [Actinomycetota bacterium]|nr:hypothetical protein [Actinomycetota bacterium]